MIAQNISKAWVQPYSLRFRCPPKSVQAPRTYSRPFHNPTPGSRSLSIVNSNASTDVLDIIPNASINTNMSRYLIPVSSHIHHASKTKQRNAACNNQQWPLATIELLAEEEAAQ